MKRPPKKKNQNEIMPSAASSCCANYHLYAACPQHALRRTHVLDVGLPHCPCHLRLAAVHIPYNSSHLFHSREEANIDTPLFLSDPAPGLPCEHSTKQHVHAARRICSRRKEGYLFAGACPISNGSGREPTGIVLSSRSRKCSTYPTEIIGCCPPF